MSAPRCGKGLAVAAGVFAGALLVYVLTLAPTIAGKDSGELAAAIYALGIPHTTGYPFYVLLAKAFSLLAPIGSIAYRANLFSAVSSAAACATLAFAAYRVTGSRSAAALAGLSAAFIPLDWSQSLIANVYGLANLIIAACLVAFIALQRGRGSRQLAAFWGLCGLATSHHRSSLFVLLPFLAASVWWARRLGWRAWLKAAAWFVLPFAAYLYVPLRGGADVRALSGTADTWKDFVDLFTGRVYQKEYLFAGTLRQALNALHDLSAGALASLSIAGLLLALVGWLALARRERALWIASTVGFLLLVLWTLAYSVETSVSFITPCYLLLGLWIGSGGWVIGGYLRRSGRPGWSAAVMAAMTAALTAHLLVLGWARVSGRRHWEVYDEARVMLAEMPRGAIAVIDGHPLAFAASYLQLVEKARPDVTIVNAELSVRAWYLRRLRNPVVSQAAAMAERAYPGAPDPYTSRWVNLLTTALAIVAPPGAPICTNAPLEAPAAPPGVLIERGIETTCLVKAAQPPTAPCAASARTLGSGISLAGVRFAPGGAAPGTLVVAELPWRCERPVPQPGEVLILAQAPGARMPALWQSAPFLMGLALPPTPAGRCYLQRIPFIVPRNAVPGPQGMAVALRGPAARPGPLAAGGFEVIR